MKNRNISSDNRHAYLILAHKDDLVLRTLISMLDDPRNDIFIHMDKKTANFDEQKILGLAKKSHVVITPRITVSWGAYNIIDAELILLKEATKYGHYAYYHLLSGQDLPIKTQDYIHSFFDKNRGKEFVCFQSPSFQHAKRVKYYYPFQDRFGKKSSLCLRAFNIAFPLMQKIVGVNRNKGISFQKGTQWFSITDDLARHVVQKEPWIKETFKSTLCCDEVFLHTIIINSKFRNNLYRKEFDDDRHANMRLIDWNRGKPYVFRTTDLDEIRKSDCLFVRKIDASIDSEVISNIQMMFGAHGEDNCSQNKNRMKILHVTSIDDPNGNGVAVAVGHYYEYEKKMADVAIYNMENNFIKSEFSYDAAKYKDISSLPNGFNKPDLIVFNEVYKLTYLKLYKECVNKNIPYIIVPHGCLTREAQKKSRIKKKIANPLLFEKFIHNALAIQYLNIDEMKKSIVKDKKYIIAGNGIIPKNEKNLAKNKDFVYIGRYSIKHKGLDLIADMVAYHKEWFLENKVQIRLYGRDSDNDYIKLARIVEKKSISDVMILGEAAYGDAKKHIMLDAYAFIQPSRWEGQPMGVLDALSYGLPCVVTYETTFGEYVNDNKCGIGIDFDSEELFNAIEKMSEDRKFRDECAKNTIAIERDYDWENVTKKCLSEYRGLICSLT